MAVAGIVKLASPLDYEKLERFTVSVVATDSGIPPLSSRCTIEVEVLDVNDNPPRFSQSIYKGSVRENEEEGTRILQVCLMIHQNKRLVSTVSESLFFFKCRLKLSYMEGGSQPCDVH